VTTNPTSLMTRMERDVRTNFEDRLAKVRRGYFRLLSEIPVEAAIDVRELAAELTTMPDTERFTLLRRIVPNTDGPRTLEGLETLQSFVENYMLDDGECMVVPEPDPDDLDEDPGFATLLSLIRGDDDLPEEEARAKALALHAERERPLVVAPASADAKPARPAEILAAIAHNRRLERRREAEFDAFMSDREPASPGF
jgi:hypothetical protein